MTTWSATCVELLPLNPVDEEYVGQGRELACLTDQEHAIDVAERLAGALPDRWANFGVAGEEYRDLARSRRQRNPGDERA